MPRLRSEPFWAAWPLKPKYPYCLFYLSTFYEFLTSFLSKSLSHLQKRVWEGSFTVSCGNKSLCLCPHPSLSLSFFLSLTRPSHVCVVTLLFTDTFGPRPPLKTHANKSTILVPLSLTLTLFYFILFFF